MNKILLMLIISVVLLVAVSVGVYLFRPEYVVVMETIYPEILCWESGC